nr:molluscan insulin-related peptide II B chain, MIP II [Lymnaea stagnalis=freshwater snails, median lip nerves, Peptide Partial, 35 aa] [Lymnaea stagnalis]
QSSCSLSSRPHPRGICGSNLAGFRAFICSNQNSPS